MQRSIKNQIKIRQNVVNAVCVMPITVTVKPRPGIRTQCMQCMVCLAVSYDSDNVYIPTIYRVYDILVFTKRIPPSTYSTTAP